MQKFIINITNDLMPILAAKLWEDYPERSIELIKRLPGYDKRSIEMDWAPFLLTSAADVLFNTGNHNDALLVSSIAFKKYENLKSKLDSGKAQNQYPDSIIRRFAAYTKWREAFIVMQLNKIERALQCYTLAAEIDLLLAPKIIEERDSMIKIDEPEGISVTFSSPFLE
jgi:hypothetical protein